MISTAIPLSQIARGLGILTTFVQPPSNTAFFLAPQIAVLAQGNTAETFPFTRLTLTGGAAEAASVFGAGSPIHTIVRNLLPSTGGDASVGSTPITIYPLDDGTTPAIGDITPSGATTPAASSNVIAVIIGGVRSQNITITRPMTVADQTAAITTGINGTLNMPVIAADGTTVVNLSAKWQGATGNDITIEVVDSAATGITYAITAMNAGAGNPLVPTILGTMGDQWDNLVINGLNLGDSNALDAIQAHGDGRWAAQVHKPYMAFVGSSEATDATVIAIGDGRKDDRVSSVSRGPGSRDQPWAIAARAVARIANQMRDNPPVDYARLTWQGIRVGPDSAQADVFGRDALVKAGISTTEVVDGVYEMSDTVTFYHPDDEEIPGYRFVAKNVRLMNVIYNIELEFRKKRWDGAPLLPDTTPTTNPAAVKPKDARAELATITDNLANAAILANPEETKDKTQVIIGGDDRLEMKIPVTLSANSRQRSINLDFSFLVAS